ncbi:MAG: hypothetical protein M9944_12960 [Rhizobiaceae bacterium]|nr:hypothetical protein [Rhizobiaceae bacterium]
MPAITASRYLVQAGWDSVPHLDEKTKKELLESTPPHLREARSKGIPSLGSGAIYPVPLSAIEIQPFQIPPFWPRAYALDVGWKRTAALWGAWDTSDWSLYLYAEHYQGQAVASIHADAIKARGDWIRGVIDPAADNRSQRDGERLMADYVAHGLHLTPADNAVEAGLYKTWQLLATGRLKVFSTLANWKAEYALYRRDENGKIIKDFDHLMDCMRYIVMSGQKVASVKAPTVINDAYLPVGDSVAGY